MNEVKKYDPKGAQIFGALVYVGVVVAVTTMFVSFILTAFPPDAYFSRVVMGLAGLLVGASAIAFPVALHTWTVERVHRGWTTAFYYGEIVIMAVNSVVSFMVLLSQNVADFVLPDWAVMYEPFSIVAIVYTLFAWGTVFLLDPEHKRIQKDREADQKFEDELANKMLEFVNSTEGEDLVIDIATERAKERYNPERFRNVKKSFGSGKSAPARAPEIAVDPERGFVAKESTTSAPLPQADGETR